MGDVIVIRGRSARELAELAMLMGVEPEEAVEILVREALERRWRLRLFLETLREAGEAGEDDSERVDEILYGDAA